MAIKVGTMHIPLFFQNAGIMLKETEEGECLNMIIELKKRIGLVELSPCSKIIGDKYDQASNHDFMF